MVRNPSQRREPDQSVGSHLAGGINAAISDLENIFGGAGGAANLYRDLARVVVGAASTLHLDRGSTRAFWDGDGDPAAIAKEIHGLFARGRDEALNYAVNLELAELAVDRAAASFLRLRDISVQLARHPLPERALAYTREAVQSYIFGFDAATIALARASLEQCVVGACDRAGIPFDGSPALACQLSTLRRVGLLVEAYEPAMRIKRRANDLLHRSMFSPRVIRRIACDTVRDLALVAAELL